MKTLNFVGGDMTCAIRMIMGQEGLVWLPARDLADAVGMRDASTFLKGVSRGSVSMRWVPMVRSDEIAQVRPMLCVTGEAAVSRLERTKAPIARALRDYALAELAVFKKEGDLE